MTAATAAPPDRTPPSVAARIPGRRIQKTCAICGAPFLIVPWCQQYYRTCSQECTYRLRSRQRRGRPWSEGARQADRTWKSFR
jgi:hypothetical protein